MKKLIFGLFFVLSQTIAFAGEPSPLKSSAMQLYGTDARELFSAMAVNPVYGSDELGPFMIKTLQIGSGKETVSIRCEINHGGEAAGCKLEWSTVDSIQAGKTTVFTEEFSQGLISKLSLLPKGNGLSALELYAFTLACTQVITPTDLPFYTSCSLAVAAE